MESLVHKNVEQQLLGQRNHQRPNGETIYCFPYTKDILDLWVTGTRSQRYIESDKMCIVCSDNWDFLFQTKYCCRNGLTMNQFDTPPQMGEWNLWQCQYLHRFIIHRSVLDVGCGAGLWTIEAAKQWKVKLDYSSERLVLTSSTTSTGKQNHRFWLPKHHATQIMLANRYCSTNRMGPREFVCTTLYYTILDNIWRHTKSGGSSFSFELLWPRPCCAHWISYTGGWGKRTICLTHYHRLIVSLLLLGANISRGTSPFVSIGLDHPLSLCFRKSTV